MTAQNDQFDSPWKEIIEAYFPDFIHFFFPHIGDEIDWNRGYDFLDQELQQVVRDAELGKRLADKLVKVWKRSGEETWVLIHAEIQNQEEADFSKRIFVYYYRLLLTKRLYEQGFGRQDILDLFRFLDWLLVLPEGLTQVFQRELEQYEQEKQMPYITSIEQMAVEKGRVEGRVEARLATQSEIALSLLRQNVSLDVIVQATGLTIGQIQALPNL